MITNPPAPPHPLAVLAASLFAVALAAAAASVYIRRALKRPQAATWWLLVAGLAAVGALASAAALLLARRALPPTSPSSSPSTTPPVIYDASDGTPPVVYGVAADARAGTLYRLLQVAADGATSWQEERAAVGTALDQARILAPLIDHGAYVGAVDDGARTAQLLAAVLAEADGALEVDLERFLSSLQTGAPPALAR